MRIFIPAALVAAAILATGDAPGRIALAAVIGIAVAIAVLRRAGQMWVYQPPGQPAGPGGNAGQSREWPAPAAAPGLDAVLGAFRQALAELGLPSHDSPAQAASCHCTSLADAVALRAGELLGLPPQAVTGQWMPQQ